MQFCVFVRSWCIGGIAIFPGGNFSDRAFYSDFAFSATLQDFCCRITETSNFFSAVCHIPVYISFVFVQYHRLNACVQSLRQRNYIQLQKNDDHHSSTAPPYLSSCCCILLCWSALANLSTPVSGREAFLYSGHISGLIRIF